MRRWILKHSATIMALVTAIQVIPMNTNCRMFIGQPKAPDKFL